MLQMESHYLHSFQRGLNPQQPTWGISFGEKPYERQVWGLFDENIKTFLKLKIGIHWKMTSLQNEI